MTDEIFGTTMFNGQ